VAGGVGVAHLDGGGDSLDGFLHAVFQLLQAF
jgi:hypothetical protein